LPLNLLQGEVQTQEDRMDRRTFLAGVLGLAGASTLAVIARPASAVAGVPNTSGVLDELDASPIDTADGFDQPEVELVNHRWRRWHHRPHHGHRRRHRRRVWRRICHRYWHHGRWHRRCYRRRVWVWSYW
jgi:hypothetical protein